MTACEKKIERRANSGRGNRYKIVGENHYRKEDCSPSGVVVKYDKGSERKVTSNIKDKNDTSFNR